MGRFETLAPNRFSKEILEGSRFSQETLDIQTTPGDLFEDLVPPDIPEIADPQDIGPTAFSPKVETVQRPRWDEFVDATARGVARVGSAGLLAGAGLAEPKFRMIGFRKVPITPPQKRAFQASSAKLRKGSDFLWNLSQNPGIAAQNKDIASKALNLIGETIPYITATTAAFITAGPVGAFTVGSLVEGNSAYRVALDSGVDENKAKNIGIGVGVISGAVEAFGGRFAEQLALKAISKFKNKAVKAGAVFGIGTIVEALEEGAQEVAQIVGEETYRDVDWNERTTRILSSMAGGGFLGGVMRGGSVAARGIIGTAEKTVIAEQPTAKVTPQKRDQAIDFVRNALRQEKFAALDEKTRAEIGQRMLAEQGVDVELEELAETPATAPSEVLETSEQLSDRLEEQYGNNVIGVDHALLFGKTDKKFNEIVGRLSKLFDADKAKSQEYENLLIQKLKIIEQYLDKAETPATVGRQAPETPIQTILPSEVAGIPQIAPTPKLPARDKRGQAPAVEEFQKTPTNKQAADLGFTKADQAVIAYIESRGAQVNISGVPLEEWFTYRTPEGLLIQSDAEIIGKGGYPELRALAEKWLSSREAPAAPEKRTVAEIQAEIDSLLKDNKDPPTELLAEFNAAVKEAKLEKPITGKVITVEKTSEVKTKIPKAPKEPVTENPTIPLKGKEAQVFREEVRTQEKITEAESGEVGIEPAGASLTDHIDTFHTYQLPSTSKIPQITKQMKRVNGLRLAGKLTPQEANRKIYNLRKDVVQAAIKEKIALRVSKKGKVKIALRQSGVFVPEEVATYKKYKDIEPILGGGQDITRAIQQMDGSLSIKEKLKAKGQAGPIERFVLWRTRKMSLQKLNWLKEKTIEIRGILSAAKGSIKDKEINIILEQIGSADRDLPVKDVLDKKTKMSKESIEAARELRQFYDDLIEEQNAARLMRGQSEILYRQKYSPNILRDTTVWEQVFLRDKTAKILERGDLPDYIKPNAPFNPRAQAREAKIPYDKRVLSARELAESYIITASKDIFNTSIIQNNKAFIDQLKGQGLEKSAEYLAEWTATSYAGIKPRLDRAVKLPKWAAGGLRYFNRLRNLAVFPLNVAWSLSTQPLSLSNTIGRYGLPNTVRGFSQWLKPSIRKQAAQDYFSFIVKTTKRGGVTKQDASNLLGENIKTRKTVGEFVENFTTILLTEMEKLLTGASIRAAHVTGLKRGLKGEALKQFASDGGGKTQSMYNDEDKPMILRSLLVKSGAPYQTYAFEVANTFREWAGRTGTPPDTKLYALWSLTRWLAALIVLKMMGNSVRGREWSWWDLIPLPFSEFWLTPIARKLTGEFVPGSAGLPAPVETATRVAAGINDVLEEGNWRKLRNEMLKYGPGVFRIPGGVQWARMVDAIIVYSSGGLTDRKGKVMFEMKDPEDLARAIFTGVWSTEGGKEKLEPTKKESRKFKFGER
ncbi:hypothetical protein LCGC14_0390590 [marine sediment metagenome]|uniref:Large polyvalent protein associated domain-containing protein n=1 Tax=marine sediment metagenome TaxID=412755 RepID=A0A0F9T5I5_9ZZZZ